MENEKKRSYKRPVDEYLPCEEYKGDNGFIRFFKEDEKRYYFAYNGNNGTTYLKSQGYTSEPGRDNGIDSVIRNARLDERWATKETEDGKFYYLLKAGNRQEIARSCYYNTKEEMESALNWVRGEESTIGKGAKEIDGVWWSTAMLLSKSEAVNEVEYLKKSNMEPVAPVSSESVEESETKKEEEKDSSKPVAVAVAEETTKTGCGHWWLWLLLLAAIIVLCLIFC